jgi:hypothetical protein
MALTKVGGSIIQNNINVVGVVTASAFVGDGSQLTGVTTNYYKGEVFGYDNVINSNISVTSSYKTAAIYSDRDLTVDIENGVTVTVDADCYLNIVDV